MTQVINGRLLTPSGATSSLVFDLPASMINSTKTEQRLSAYGQANYSTSGQIAKFVLPRTDRSFINTQTMYLTGNVDLAGNFGAGGTDVDICYVLGTYYSLFSRQVVSSNGKQLEAIERPGELVNMILNQTLNPAEKRGMANTMGFNNDLPAGEGDATLQICQPINTGNASTLLMGGNQKSFSFALPVVGILNSSKFLPCINGDWTVEYTINALSNFLVGKTAAANTAITTGTITFNISNLELVYDQITLTPESFALVMQNYPEKLYIKSQSYDFTSSPPLAVSTGSYDIPCNIKRSSLKEVLFYFNQHNCIDKSFGAVNCNLMDYTFQTNGTQYPIRPVRVNINPSEVFNQVAKSYGSLYSNDHGGSMGRLEFCRRSNGNNQYYATLTNAVPANITIASNKFYLAIDTEIINYFSESLYSGIPMGVNSSWRINISETTADTTVVLYAWLVYDAIIEMDLVNGINSVIA